MKNFSYRKCLIETNEKFGRFIVAAEDIKAGELLLSEFPVVVGPYWDSKVSCLNCYAPSDVMCKKCKVVPLCWNCYDQHNVIECRTLGKLNLPNTFLVDNFDVVTPLRVLLLLYQRHGKKQNDENDDQSNIDVEEILSMESHCLRRRNTWIWNAHAKSVVEPLRSIAAICDVFQLDEMPWKITDEFIQKICGILDVNTFEVRTANFEELPVRGLYTQAALLAHDCTGNTFITVDNAKQLKVFASINIAAGEIIYNNYTATLYGTEARQEHLTKGKYFQCECRRCIDPTELGTHLSSLKCRSCQIGYVLQMECKTMWKCLNCNAIESHEKIELMLCDIRHRVNRSGLRLEHIEFFIKKYSSVLHPNHYLLIEMKQKLAAMIRHMGERNSEYCNSEKLLQRKIELCKEIVPLLGILQPGISRLKGIALYEQFIPLVQLAKLYYQRKAIHATEYVECLREAECIAKESIRMLIYEPMTNPEGMLAKQAMHELQELRTIKQRIEKMALKESVTGKK